MRSGPSHGQETERDGNVLDASAVDPQFAYLFASLITDFLVGTGQSPDRSRWVCSPFGPSRSLGVPLLPSSTPPKSYALVLRTRLNHLVWPGDPAWIRFAAEIRRVVGWATEPS